MESALCNRPGFWYFEHQLRHPKSCSLNIATSSVQKKQYSGTEMTSGLKLNTFMLTKPSLASLSGQGLTLPCRLFTSIIIPSSEELGRKMCHLLSLYSPLRGHKPGRSLKKVFLKFFEDFFLAGGDLLN